MLNTFLKMNQPVCVILWIAVVYNLLFPLSGMLYTVLLYAGPVLLIVHIGEWLILRGRLKGLGHEGFPAFLKVLVFGFSWWLPVLRDAKAQAH